ncbi:hypothetical protein B296_00016268 [Ensete ventricosum]|uniref:Uncharacterized protein n=1 Tax=Ensete ventricosum TaxID=4639 RepID=A0A426ZNJ9_ENSVE|nr:hypothetical protein B296_00016268 [Ensete ventricosum]
MLIYATFLVLADYCTTLEGDDDCHGCWRAYFELKDLQETLPKEDVEKFVRQAGGIKSLISYLHCLTAAMLNEKEKEICPQAMLNKKGKETPQPKPVTSVLRLQESLSMLHLCNIDLDCIWDVKRGRNARPFPASPGSRERTRAREAAESQPATHLERLLGWRACPPGPRRRDRGARERDRRMAVVVYSSPSASPRRTAPHRHPSAARGVISSPPSSPYPRHANIPMGKSSSLDPPCQKIPNASSQGCSSSGHGAYSRSTQSAVPSVSVGYWKLRRGLGILWLRAAPAPPHGMASGGHLPAPRQRCSLQYEHCRLLP